jgi:hypothetical protein
VAVTRVQSRYFSDGRKRTTAPPPPAPPAPPAAAAAAEDLGSQQRGAKKSASTSPSRSRKRLRQEGPPTTSDPVLPRPNPKKKIGVGADGGHKPAVVSEASAPPATLPPHDFDEVWRVVERLRFVRDAPVDIHGAEVLGGEPHNTCTRRTALAA